MAGPWEKYKRPVDPTGNPIDTARPRIENPDGSFSTEKTIGIEMDGRYYNIPTIVNGQQLTDDQAVEAFRSGTNKAVGEFTSQAEADAAAAPRSSTIGQVRGPWEKYQPQQVPAPSGPAPGAAVPSGSEPLLYPDPPAPAPVNQGMDAPVYVAQRGDRGLADAIGAPVDIVAGIANLGLFGTDKLAELFGGNVDTRVEKPFMGSDWIADMASKAAGAVGTDIVPPEAVSPGVRLAGTAAEGAAAALVPAMGLASAPVQTAAKAGKPLLQSLAKPYSGQPGGALVRDGAAGAGSAIAAEGYDKMAPEAVQDSAADPLLKMLASILGGVGAMAPLSLAEGAAGAGKNYLRNKVMGPGDPSGFTNPNTGQAFTRSDMDLGATIAQRMASSPNRAVDNIEANNADFATFTTPQQRPTVAMLADDVGLSMGENVQRTRNPQAFAERDASRQMAAVDELGQSAPRGADPRAFTGEATRQYDDTLAVSRQSVDDAVAEQAKTKADLQKQNADLEGYRAGQPQVSSALAEDFDLARRSAREQKNALYDAADPKTPVDGRFLDEAVTRIDADMADAEKMVDGPYAQIAQRVKSLVQQVDPETGDVTVKDVTYADIKALRAQVSEARKAAVAASGQSVAGSGADVRRLDQLGAVLNKLSDDINPEAARFYREEYAPRFKQGRAGEYGAARDRATRTGNESSATRPSEFGEKFLKRPEDAAILRRALAEPPSGQPQIPGPAGSANAPAGALDPKIEQNAKEWMLGDLAKSGVLTDNAEIRFDKFKQWADKNRATIDQFPDIAKTVNAELARAQQGGMLSKQLAADVAAAKEGMAKTEADLRRSPLQAAIGNNPVNAVESIMSSGDPEKQMTDLVARLGSNPDAIDGLKGAVRDWIKQNSDTTARIVGSDGQRKPSRARLEKLFSQHEKTLAKLYSPEEMNALRRVHKLLDVEAALDVRTTAGSNTLDKVLAEQNAAVEQALLMSEGGLKLWFGMLRGGGMMRAVNTFISTLPDRQAGVKDIVQEMWFNPELAAHLLKRPTKAEVPMWNARLNRLLAAATGGRASAEEKKKPLEVTVTKPGGAQQ